jgi:hypothetical protein
MGSRSVHSITSSARASSDGGTVNPSAGAAAIRKFVSFHYCRSFCRVIPRTLKPLNMIAETTQFGIASGERFNTDVVHNDLQRNCRPSEKGNPAQHGDTERGGYTELQGAGCPM